MRLREVKVGDRIILHPDMKISRYAKARVNTGSKDIIEKFICTYTALWWENDSKDFEFEKTIDGWLVEKVNKNSIRVKWEMENSGYVFTSEEMTDIEKYDALMSITSQLLGILNS